MKNDNRTFRLGQRVYLDRDIPGLLTGITRRGELLYDVSVFDPLFPNKHLPKETLCYVQGIRLHPIEQHLDAESVCRFYQATASVEHKLLFEKRLMEKFCDLPADKLPREEARLIWQQTAEEHRVAIS